MTTTIIQLCLLASLWCGGSPSSPRAGFGGCVPSEIDLNSVILSDAGTQTAKAPARQTTVKQKLTQLKARCRKGKLVSGNNKPIYLYPMIGCWGNPPQDYLEMLQHQEEEIQKLKKTYIVIQIPCAQGQDPRLISQTSH